MAMNKVRVEYLFAASVLQHHLVHALNVQPEWAIESEWCGGRHLCPATGGAQRESNEAAIKRRVFCGQSDDTDEQSAGFRNGESAIELSGDQTEESAARVGSMCSNVDSPPEVLLPSSAPYNLSKSRKDFDYSQYGQSKLLLQIFGGSGPGFFVESGALDGEQDSNTLAFEHLGWSGLLVEPNPDAFAKLQLKHRKAYSFNGCLSTTGKSGRMSLKMAGAMSTVSLAQVDTRAEPLVALLEHLNVTTVDLWSLDVEGVEGAVLESTDFTRLELGVAMIEMNKGDDNNMRIKAVMDKIGMMEIGRTYYLKHAVLDRIFANESYFKVRGLRFPEKIDNPEGLR